MSYDVPAAAEPARDPHHAGRRVRTVAMLAFSAVTGLYVAGAVSTVLAGERLWPAVTTGMVLYAFPAVGALIVVRRPGNRIGWLCLVIGALLALESALWGAAMYGFAHPGSIPRPELLAVLADPLPLPAVFLIVTLLLLLFPDGHLPSRRWRWLVWSSLGSIAGIYVLGLTAPDTSSAWGRPTVDNPLALEVFDVLEVPVVIVLFACVAGSLVALVRRYRRSTGVERLQFRWLRAVSVIAVVSWLVGVFVLDGWLGEEAALVASSALVLVPVAIGFSITRYRLYDIDRLVSRTLGYALVLGVLVAVYAGGVLLVRSLLPTESDVAVAASTLMVAALFAPLRRRIQGRVDRRFNRARHDVGRVMDAFGVRLRDPLDLDELLGDLAEVVTTTMQPASVMVWMVGDPADGPAGLGPAS